MAKENGEFVEGFVIPEAIRDNSDGSVDYMVSVTGPDDSIKEDIVKDWAGFVGIEFDDISRATEAEINEVETFTRADNEGRTSFFMSSGRWRAPWQPTGPRPPWGNNNDATAGEPN